MKWAAVLCFVLALAAGGVWLAQGRELVTRTEKLVVEKVKDEFGDEVEKKRWEKHFAVGLELVGPAGGGLVLLGGVLLFVARRRAKKAAKA